MCGALSRGLLVAADRFELVPVHHEFDLCGYPTVLCWTYYWYKHCRIERSFRQSVRDKRRYAWKPTLSVTNIPIHGTFVVPTFLWVGGEGYGGQRLISACGRKRIPGTAYLNLTLLSTAGSHTICARVLAHELALSITLRFLRCTFQVYQLCNTIRCVQRRATDSSGITRCGTLCGHHCTLYVEYMTEMTLPPVDS